MASLPYPRCRPRGCSCLSCTNRTSGEEAPTECTELTEPLAEKSLPQMTRMFTDVGGYGIPAIPTLPALGVQLCRSVKSVGGKRFPQNARNSQNLLQRKDSHRWHRCRRVWHPCHTHAAKFCGRTAHPKYLCKSVKSVGGHLSRRFCEFGVFRGRISHSRRRGYGKMPYPPKEKSVGGSSQQEVL